MDFENVKPVQESSVEKKESPARTYRIKADDYDKIPDGTELVDFRGLKFIKQGGLTEDEKIEHERRYGKFIGTGFLNKEDVPLGVKVTESSKKVFHDKIYEQIDNTKAAAEAFLVFDRAVVIYLKENPDQILEFTKNVFLSDDSEKMHLYIGILMDKLSKGNIEGNKSDINIEDLSISERSLKR